MDQQFTTRWIQKLSDGDSLAAEKIWQHYYDRLVRLARNKLAAGRRRVADEEDVVVVAFNSFFRGVEQGRFPKLEDRHDLWQLLVMLTARKAIDQIQHECRQKRGGGKILGESIYQRNSEPDPGLAEVIGDEPSPEFAAQMAEHMEQLLRALNDATLERVALAKLEGFSNQEIADQLQCGLRTVERKLKLIRTVWQEQEAHDRRTDSSADSTGSSA
jgi:RNA polymerase sigma factor (sigma-70 family)